MPAAAPPFPQVSELLRTASAMFRVTLLKCLPIAMLALLCLYAPLLYWIGTGHAMESGMPTDARSVVLSLLSNAVFVYLGAALMLRQRAFGSGAAVNIRAELAAAARRLPMLWGTWLLMSVSLALGLLLLVLPALFLLVCYLVLPAVVLYERHNPYSALLRSVLLVRPHWTKIFATLVFALLMMVIVAFTIGAAVSILAALLPGPVSLGQAVMAAGAVAIGAAMVVFMSALSLTLHSAASSSA